MKKLLLGAMCVMPMVAHAAIPYSVEQISRPVSVAPDGIDDEAFARLRRFYIGGAYNFSMWDSYTDDVNVRAGGKNTSGFDVVAGVRLYDTFRIEANYIHMTPKWNSFKLTSNAAMVNAIFDARIDNIYRILRTQRLVPYVGAGAGMTWNSSDDVHMEHKSVPIVAALAGVGVELGTHFALDFGYRYFYMFSPKFDTITDMNPTSHQFRVGVRVNF